MKWDRVDEMERDEVVQSSVRGVGVGVKWDRVEQGEEGWAKVKYQIKYFECWVGKMSQIQNASRSCHYSFRTILPLHTASLTTNKLISLA